MNRAVLALCCVRGWGGCLHRGLGGHCVLPARAGNAGREGLSCDERRQGTWEVGLARHLNR